METKNVILELRTKKGLSCLLYTSDAADEL